MGLLYTVATPIGNLGDITFRAIETLKTVDLILCEDTRVTKRLLTHYEITTPTRSYHQHSAAGLDQWVVKTLQTGKNLALVSDAGTPAISDPGSRLVQAVIAAGLTVAPIPGSSAVIASLQAAGMDTSQFSFVGFIPHKKGRQTLLQQLATSPHTTVAYESSHRLLKTLASLAEYNCTVVVARELTKIHEEFVRGSSKTVYETFLKRPHIKGECVLLVSAADTVVPR